MPIEIDKTNLVYFPIPKVACTSLKHVVYLINHGSDFTPDIVDGVETHIHNIYPSLEFSEFNPADYTNAEKVVVIRDPVQRLLSAYSNRVEYYDELSAGMVDMGEARALGVRPNPSPDEFFTNMDAYRTLSWSIRHHTGTFMTFMGEDIGYFDHVYKIDCLGDLKALLEERSGLSLHLPHEQTGGRKIAFSSLSYSAQKKLLDYCAADYEFLKDHCSPPELSSPGQAA